MRIVLLYIVTVFTLAWHGSTSAANLRTLDLRAQHGTEQCVFTLSADAPHRAFLLERPDRLVVDISGLKGGRAWPLPQDYQGALVKTIRFGQFDANTSRFVLDLAKPVSIQKTFMVPEKDSSATRLVIQFSEKLPSEKPVPEKPIAEKPVPEKQSAANATAPVSSAHSSSKKTTTSPVIAEKVIAEKVVAENAKPIIVVDAGHGGTDPGATASSGRLEKDLTLDYARALRQELLSTGRYRVVLTRDSDYFILLQDRVKKARNAKGDIFISLHADTAPVSEARGMSVYTLSEKASDAASEALAEQENKADTLGGISFAPDNEQVADILLDLARRETKNKSSALAEAILRAVRESTMDTLEKPHRFAGFAVLKAPDIPSVLIETGFISNNQEEELLAKPEHRGRLLRAVVNGVDHYFASQKK